MGIEIIHTGEIFRAGLDDGDSRGFFNQFNFVAIRCINKDKPASG